MTAIIVRDLNDGIDKALKREAQKRSLSVNKLVQQYIITGLKQDGAPSGNTHHNDLSKFAGRWNAKQLKEFQAATEGFDQIEPELWK